MAPSFGPTVGRPGLPPSTGRLGRLAPTMPEDRRPPIYTRTGDDGTTGLLYGGRVSKSDPVMEATGTVDEAQAALGLARAETERGSPLDAILVRLQRDLYVLMAELATAPDNRPKLKAGVTLVSPDMVRALEQGIDDAATRFAPLTDFVLPGANRVSAALDVARTVTRRAERVVHALDYEGLAAIYLNRLSDLLWALARWQDDGESLVSRRAKP
jgi:cob(I)alamin adenosyltransferase